VSARAVSGGELTPEQRRIHRVEHILRRDGGSPGSALEGLAAIVEDNTWAKVPCGPDDSRPFATFRHFVEAAPPFGLGYSTKQLGALLQLQHPGEGSADIHSRMEAMRSEVRQLLASAIEPAAPSIHAGPGRGHETDGATKGFGANTAEYVVGRLKRDDPTLAERVVRGEVTANAAARQAGIRKPRILLTSPASVAAALRRHMSADDLARLISLLLKPETD